MEKVIDCSLLDLESYDLFLKAKLSPFYNVDERIVKIKEELVSLNELNIVEKNESHLFEGERNKPVNEWDVSGDEWIEWACGVWTGIRESDTLNVRGTKQDDDVKHICPLNLEVIRRCVRMYSKKGWEVLDPFNGIGSSGVISLQLGRKYVGIELKEEYFEESTHNLKRANLFEKKPELTIKQIMKIHKNQNNLTDFIK